MADRRVHQLAATLQVGLQVHVVGAALARRGAAPPDHGPTRPTATHRRRLIDLHFIHAYDRSEYDPSKPEGQRTSVVSWSRSWRSWSGDMGSFVSPHAGGHADS